MSLALALAACTTTNPPYEAGADATRPDAALQCDPESCSSGRCINGRCAESCGPGTECPSGETCCDDTFCTDLTDDPHNCGACGTVCGPRQSCIDATCSTVIL
ncbi:MAG TPA: hypothetical protein VLM85_17305 [Polyangiaceae bacterium]|nr:hypothetical protein [Polyangiaceae bacterium]